MPFRFPQLCGQYTSLGEHSGHNRTFLDHLAWSLEILGRWRLQKSYKVWYQRTCENWKGSIPVLNQVMVAARGATDAFSGVQRHVNGSLRKVGAKNIEAGIGCGIGFGHGFGVGLAVKPHVVHQIQSHLFQAVTHAMEKLGIASTLPINQGVLPASLQTSTKMIKDSVSSSSFQDNVQDGKSSISSEGALVPKSDVIKTQHRSRTEIGINNFLKNPLLKEDSEPHEEVEPLRLENNMLQMVLKHQLLIEELMQHNEKLHQILVEELKVEPGKLQPSFTSRNKSPCTECFECQNKEDEIEIGYVIFYINQSEKWEIFY